MNLIDHIVECENKFTEKFGEPPNTVYMNPWLWEKIKEETRWFAKVGGSVAGYHDTFIMDMRVRVDRALDKNAIRIVKCEYFNGIDLTTQTTYEIMYLLPIRVEPKNEWRHIILC